jgi:hypothetical protein
MIELLTKYGALGIVMAVTTTFLGGYFTEAGKSFWSVTKTHGVRWLTVLTSHLIVANFFASIAAVIFVGAVIWYSKKFDLNLKMGLLVVLNASGLMTFSVGAFIFWRLYGLGRYVNDLHDCLIELEKRADRQPAESQTENNSPLPSESQAQ